MKILCYYLGGYVEPRKTCLTACKNCSIYKEEQTRQKNLERMKSYAKTVSK